MQGRTIRRAIVLALFVAAGLLVLVGGTASAKTVWLCKPGLADNPCKTGLKTTVIAPDGNVERTKKPKRKPPLADCFYVYPTVSDDDARNSDRQADPEERSIALYQAARFGQYCRVFAPMYRQITIKALFSGEPVTAEEAGLAYGDVVAAWRTYLRRYNHGRPFVLIGHSQGTRWLRILAAEKIDDKPSVLSRMLSAILLGGNVLVAKHETVGGDFEHIPACQTSTQIGCVIAFSTFNDTVPPDSRFGRPGGVFGGDPATQDVLCTNPAALGGGPAPLKSIIPSEPFAPGTTIGVATGLVGMTQPDVPTPWIEADGAYAGECSSAADANVLQLTDAPGAPHLNPVPDDTWGLHLVDGNIALGNLVDLVRKQAHAYR